MLDTLQIPPVCCHLLDEVPLEFPFWRYYELYRGAAYSFLLDSAKPSGRLGRYSFIGGDPSLVYRAKSIQGSGFKVHNSYSAANLRPAASSLQPGELANIEVIELADSQGRQLQKPITTRRIATPFEDLRQLLAAHRADYRQYAGHPLPFLSGAVGYFGYEAGRFTEELPDAGADDLALPDIYLMFCSAILGHCHSSARSYLSILGRGENETAARKQAEIQRENMLSRIAGFELENMTELHSLISTGPHPNPLPKGEGTYMQDISAHCDQADYCRKIETIKNHISAGDVYQVCLTRRMDAPLVGGTAWDLYKELREVNPAPFASFLNFPEVQVVSSSPERFLSLGPDHIAESRPIKGTRPRGASPEQDRQLRQELADSSKDRAENLMIVDLVRNDFGRVCEFRSVEVPEFMLIEDYATVFQMVSTIRGRLARDRDALDLIRACFPGGSMTGAPKIEAMKIIDYLEPVKRGIYSGAIGYLDFAGPMDLSIVIRTIVIKDGRCYFHVGGGIVADSDPQAEFQETQDKARALIQALKILKAR
jgi:para-aminobenzoate synthetase component I